MAVNRIYCATGLGDGALPNVEGDLDTINGSDLADKDMAIVIDQTTVYFYALDADSGVAHDGTNYTVIKPSENAGDKRWILQSLFCNDLTIRDDVILAVDDVTIGGLLQLGTADGTGANFTVYSDTAGDHMVFDKTAKTFTLTDIALDTPSIGATTPGTIVGTTIDASTDFTIGGTVITNAKITDDGAFEIEAVTSIALDSPIVTIEDGILHIGVDDTVRGAINIYGGSNNGGTINLYIEADADDTNDRFIIDTDGGIFYIGHNNNTDIFRILANDTVSFTTAVDVDAALTATTVDADTDFTVGNTVITDGKITDSGGFNIEVGADGVFLLDDADGDWLISASSNGAVSLYHNANAKLSTAAGGITVTGDVGCTTATASTDFTVGGLVITDGNIADTGQLVFNCVSGVLINAGSDGGNILAIGGDDTGQEGTLVLYGGASDTAGGSIELYFDAGYDTNHNVMHIRCEESALTIGSNNNVDAFKMDASASVLAASFDINLSMVSPASIIMGDVSKFEWDPSPSSDATMSGEIISQTVDANASGIGALLYKAADGNWEEADADSSATIGMLGIAVESGTGTKDVLLRGFVKDTAWSWTPGQQLFVSTTTGAITATAPSGTGDIVQVVGYASEATVIYFNPSPDFIEIA